MIGSEWTGGLTCGARCVVAAMLTLATSRLPAVAQPIGSPPQIDHVDVVLNGAKVRVSLARAERMRREVIDRLSKESNPEVAELRQELAAAGPWVDRNGQLHYGRWSLTGVGSVLSLSAAFPADGPLGLQVMWHPGLHATFERKAGQWELTRVDEASTTR